MAQIVIVYAREEVAIAQSLKEHLERRGVSVFLDVADLIRGNWREVIKEEIRRSRDVVVLVSRNSAASSEVGDEVTLAASLNKQLTPVLLDDLPQDQPSWMVDLLREHAVRYDRFDLRVSTDRILAAIRSRPSPLRVHNNKFLFGLIGTVMAGFIAAILLGQSNDPVPAETSEEGAISYADRGFITYREQRWAEAESSFIRASQLAPKTANWEIRRCQWLYNAGFAAEKQERWEVAEDLYMKSLSIIKDDPQIHAAIAKAQIALEDWSHAKDHIEQALKLGTKWPLWHGTTRTELEAQLRLVQERTTHR